MPQSTASICSNAATADGCNHQQARSVVRTRAVHIANSVDRWSRPLTETVRRYNSGFLVGPRVRDDCGKPVAPSKSPCIANKDVVQIVVFTQKCPHHRGRSVSCRSQSRSYVWLLAGHARGSHFVPCVWCLFVMIQSSRRLAGSMHDHVLLFLG